MPTYTEIVRETEVNDPWLQARRAEGYMVVRGYDEAVAGRASYRTATREKVALMRAAKRAGGFTDRDWTELGILRAHYREQQRRVRIWTQRLQEQRAYEAHFKAQARMFDMVERAMFGPRRQPAAAAE